MEEKFIKILDQEICYTQSSEKGSKSLLFLHGWGQSKESFSPFFKGYGEQIRVISVDLPGFGKSEEPKTIFGVEDYSDIIKNFIDKLKLKNVIIIGHSFGCRISFYLSIKSEEVRAMLLTGAAGIKPKRSWKYYFSIFGYKFQKLLFKTPFYIQYKEDVLSQSGSSDYKQASLIMKQVLVKVVNEDLSFLFSKIEQKVVLFWGIADEATPINDAYIMERSIKNCQLIKVQGFHYAFLENQKEFYEEIKKLI